jgi:hypothetical protein
MVSSLIGQDTAVSLYLLDSNIARTPTGYLSSLLLGVSINIRFELPQLNILSKPDILNDEKIEEILTWSSEPYILEEALSVASSGLVREYSEAILQMLNNLGSSASVLPVSGKLMTGLDALYGELQRIFAGGEDYLAFE